MTFLSRSQIAGIGVAGLLCLLGACSNSPKAVAPRASQPVAPRLPVCLVLSVGADKGIAHLGVIQALKEKGVPIDCVVGTSMGAMIGGLYAANPLEDPADGYRAIAKGYEARARGEAGNGLAFGFILGGILAAASGGAAGAILLAGGTGAVAGGSSVRLIEWERLRDTLRGHYGNTTIEQLPIRFGTVYQQAGESGVQSQRITGGLVADEIAHSIANPLIFKDVHVDMKTKLDPGASEVAAIPVQPACMMFPGHQLVVSSVIGDEIFSSSKMNCPYQVVDIQVAPSDLRAALSAQEPAFSQLVGEGYQTAMHSIDWSLLPNATHAPAPLPQGSPPIRVRVDLRIDMSRTKPNGNGWDILGDLPDIRHKTKIRACESCDAYGTSASTPGLRGLKRDRLSANWEIGTFDLRPGFEFDVVVDDEDVSDDDRVGEFHIIFDGQTGTASDIVNGTTVALDFEVIE